MLTIPFSRVPGEEMSGFLEILFSCICFLHEILRTKIIALILQRVSFIVHQRQAGGRQGIEEKQIPDR